MANDDGRLVGRVMDRLESSWCSSSSSSPSGSQLLPMALFRRPTEKVVSSFAPKLSSRREELANYHLDLERAQASVEPPIGWWSWARLQAVVGVSSASFALVPLCRPLDVGRHEADGVRWAA